MLEAHFSAGNGDAPTFCIFFGSEDPGTGESWCSDCVVADPLIRSSIRKLAPSATLFECPVGDRAAYKGMADHAYRVHAQIKLQAVPQFMCWTARGPIGGALVEEECHTAENVEGFITRALADAGFASTAAAAAGAE
eukprot:a846922_27.p1 GENE.a846922_27~~a846922_27.p1  ORF type:complete len:160 (+),score=55.38 a846922_27:71-481(+)